MDVAPVHRLRTLLPLLSPFTFQASFAIGHKLRDIIFPQVRQQNLRLLTCCSIILPASTTEAWQGAQFHAPCRLPLAEKRDQRALGAALKIFAFQKGDEYLRDEAHRCICT